MFKIIGADGKEYGPITADQLRQWILEGRANGQTRILPVGTTEWKALSEFPEFSASLGARTLPPMPPPPAGATDPRALENEILSRDYQVDIGDCISRGWGLMARNFWLLIGATFVIGCIQGAVPFLYGPCVGGLYFLILRLIRGERAEFGDAFAGFSTGFLPLFLAALLKWVLVSVGLAFFILPGIYLGVAWIFAFPLIVDKKLDAWAAMELSRKVVTRHWWALFGLVIVNFLVGCVGFVCCVVGLLVAQPVIIGAIAFAYDDIFGAQPRTPMPALSARPA
jgi:hypothetical protein